MVGRSCWAACVGGVLAGALALADRAEAQHTSPTRAEDEVFFSLYGGVALSSVSHVTHWSEDGSRAELDGLGAPVSWAAGYRMAWWPNEYFGLDGSIEGFGLPLEADASRVDSCDRCPANIRPKTPRYGGFGLQVGPSVRGGLPLRYVQPNAGLGLMLPVTFQFTQEPATRLDETAIQPGVTLRTVAGVNGYVDHDWRAFAEYRLDYRLVTIGDPQAMGGDIAKLDNEQLVTHMIVVGGSWSPTGFKESPDKATIVTVPFVPPVVGWLIAALAAGVQ